VSSKSSTPEEQKPKGNFDESGKFVPSPRGNYGTAMKELIARHNDLVDASALLWDPEVIAWLLQGDNVTDKPSAIQNAAKGIQQLIDQRLEEASNNARQGAQAMLDALRAELNAEKEAALAKLVEDFTADQQATAEQHGHELDGKNARIARLNDTIGMQTRVQVYVRDVHGIVNSFIQLLAAGVTNVRSGLHPGELHVLGDTVTTSFELSGFKFTVRAQAPSALGTLQDHVMLESANDSDLPRLVPVVLETRPNSGLPGLSQYGRETLEGVLRRTTKNWFRTGVPHLTNEELARIYADPQAAVEYSEKLTRKRTSGLNLTDLLGFGEGPSHTGGENCPECKDFFSAVLGLGEDPSAGFDYVAVHPFGGSSQPARGGLGNFGFGSVHNGPVEPQANPYHYDNHKE
jgi:hypothetical protein